MLVTTKNFIFVKAPWLTCNTVLVICTLPCLGKIIPSIPEQAHVRIICPKF